MASRPDLDSQNKLGKKTGLAQSTIGRILHMVNATDVDVIDALAKAYGVQPEYLLSNGASCSRISSLLNKLAKDDIADVELFLEFLIEKRSRASTRLHCEHQVQRLHLPNR